MATQRLTMKNIREILRQKWALQRSHRDVAASLDVSAGVVGKVVGKASEAGLTWDAVQALSDEELERVVYDGEPASQARPLPDFSYIHTERRRKGVTLALLHIEYLEKHPNGYRYTQFCELYRAWLKRRGLTLRIDHVAGDKAFVDYSGNKLHIVDPNTGECIAVELFVGVLGASNLTYAEASMTQRGHDFIASNARMLEYFGGVPAALVPDQLKAAVTRPCWYDPKIQRTYAALAEHYGTTVMPARPGKPRDKAKVENAVLIAQRWIAARLRDEVFHSLPELNARIAELLEDLNTRPMRKYGNISRRALFERIERSELCPLPAVRFEHCEWKTCRVNIDYHVEIDRHYYSVPYTLVGEAVEARFTATTVELLHRGKRIASHPRSFVPGRHTTDPEHMPKAHQRHADRSPSRILAWAKQIGPKTVELAQALMKERKHPEHGYRACLGILRLGKTYGDARLEAACARAVVVRARSYRHVESILKNGLDRAPLPDLPADTPADKPEVHENIRGPRYYN
ncbi:IS21 family transposase [Nannocystis sp. ILAH1]|uniref:IS21 family transposase n=1 Tax=unclassified Nannocystis TaxID=2627009 RepID=UPI00226D9A05|nr:MULTISPECIES: IS21 family transposase [unclassified Nannocystis]MCY0993105.1 IS21 family transposase [Nannocystis sp. ILAH1]MCY1071007.1 IS21 family transposase [Nannocystis sp. RBIL2]